MFVCELEKYYILEIIPTHLVDIWSQDDHINASQLINIVKFHGNNPSKNLMAVSMTSPGLRYNGLPLILDLMNKVLSIFQDSACKSTTFKLLDLDYFSGLVIPNQYTYILVKTLIIYRHFYIG